MATSSSNSRRPVMAKNEPSAIAKLVKSMLAIILIVVASVGATLFLYDKISSNPTSVEASPDKPVPLPTPIFSPLEPFTVTLRGETSSRIQLGRASCRESVCQYVSISVVAVSLKKKNNKKQKSKRNK